MKQNYQIHYNNSAPKIRSPIIAWQKIHSHPAPLDGLCKSSPTYASPKSAAPLLGRTRRTRLAHSRSNLPLTTLDATFGVWRRVRPEQITEQPGIGDFLRSFDFFDLLHGGEFRAEPAVHAQDAVINEGGHGQVVETFREKFPNLYIIASSA